MVSAQVCWGGKDLAATVAPPPWRTVGRKWLTLLMNPGGKTGGRHVADRERADSTAARCTEPHQLATVVGTRVNRDGREVEGFRNAGRVPLETRSTLCQHGRGPGLMAGALLSAPRTEAGRSAARPERAEQVYGGERSVGPPGGPSGGSRETRRRVESRSRRSPARRATFDLWHAAWRTSSSTRRETSGKARGGPRAGPRMGPAQDR